MSSQTDTRHAAERTSAEDTVWALQNEFDRAELEADSATLERLIAEDFLSIGPKGFVLDKGEWVGRHALFSYQALDVSEMDIRLYDNTAVVRTIQRNKATYKDDKVELAVRVSQVWVRQDGRWQIAAIQFSPLAEACRGPYPTKGEPRMGRIVVTEYISVDGVVEAPSGTESFERVGWTDAFTRGPEGDQFKLDETMSSDALLLGRATYDGFAPVWPHFEGEFADKFNTMPKYVISQTLTGPEWNNTTVLTGDVVEEVRKLKERYDGDIVVHGSPQLAQTLIENDLVDALHLQVYPVIVGAGKRLFGGTSETKRLRLTSAKTVGDGIHLLTYERAES